MESNTKKYNYLLELLLYTVDTQSLLHKDNYIETRTLDLATELDEDTETTYTQFNYRSSFKKESDSIGSSEKDMFILDLLFMRSISI